MSMYINVENICKNVKEFCNKNKLSYKMLSFEPRSSRGFTSILVYNRFVSREYYVYNVSLWTEERITTDIINDIKKHFYLKDEPKKVMRESDKVATKKKDSNATVKSIAEHIYKSVEEFCNEHKLGCALIDNILGFYEIRVSNDSRSKSYYIYDPMAGILYDSALIIKDIKKFFKLDDRSEKVVPKKNKDSKNRYIPEIKNVIFNYPETTVLWEDGTKTSVKCNPEDEYSKEVGLALCAMKKAFGNTGDFNDIFRKWIPKEDSEQWQDSFFSVFCREYLDSYIKAIKNPKFGVDYWK